MTDSESNVKVKLDICDLVVNSLTFVSFHHAPFLYLLIPSPCHPELVSGSRLLYHNTMKRNSTYYVYIMTNQYNNVLYVGVTSNILKRGFEHKMEFIDGFTKKYKVKKLVYLEEYNDV